MSSKQRKIMSAGQQIKATMPQDDRGEEIEEGIEELEDNEAVVYEPGDNDQE